MEVNIPLKQLENQASDASKNLVISVERAREITRADLRRANQMNIETLLDFSTLDEEA